MKRSEINQIIRDAEAFLASRQFVLPEWANWSLADWQAKLREWNAKDRSLPPSQSNPALNYVQREYGEEDFGDDFYIDLDKYGEGGDKA